jgi:hypothetical protein
VRCGVRKGRRMTSFSRKFPPSNIPPSSCTLIIAKATCSSSPSPTSTHHRGQNHSLSPRISPHSRTSPSLVTAKVSHHSLSLFTQPPHSRTSPSLVTAKVSHHSLSLFTQPPIDALHHRWLLLKFPTILYLYLLNPPIHALHHRWLLLKFPPLLYLSIYSSSRDKGSFLAMSNRKGMSSSVTAFEPMCHAMNLTKTNKNPCAT